MKKFLFLQLKIKKTKKGFTLVELLVAASILITALGAPLYLGIQGVIIATEAKNKITATFLAEEGIELIRNIRDSNVLVILSEKEANPTGTPSRTWKKSFAEDTSVAGPTCIVSPSVNTGCLVGRRIDQITDTSIIVRRCNDAECPNLEKIVTGNEEKFGYVASAGSGEVDSGFKRTVRVTPVGSTDSEVKVAVTVEWESRGTHKEVTVEEHLFNYGL